MAPLKLDGLPELVLIMTLACLAADDSLDLGEVGSDSCALGKDGCHDVARSVIFADQIIRGRKSFANNREQPAHARPMRSPRPQPCLFAAFFRIS
jgi:hypothetical protein